MPAKEIISVFSGIKGVYQSIQQPPISLIELSKILIKIIDCETLNNPPVIIDT